MEQNTQKKILEFLERYLNFYKEFLDLENAKHSDMLSGDLSTLDRHVRGEEAFQLRARGLELERDRILSGAGYDGSTFQQLLPRFEGEAQRRAREIYGELSSVLQKMKVINLSCRELTELKLHKLEKDRQSLRGKPEIQRTYDKRAQESGRRTGAFSKKI